MKGLLRYLAATLAIFVACEGVSRAIQPLMHDASHRGLFKSALLSRKPDTRVLFVGTSRTGEALRPHTFAEAMGDPSLVAFNASVQYSSLDQALDLAPRFARAPGLSLVIIEVSDSQMRRGEVPWKETASASDFDGRVSVFLRDHSALYRERKTFVLDSLARLLGILAVGHRFDGTEQFGSDYVKKVFGGHSDVPASDFADVHCTPRPLDPPPETLSELEDARRVYAEIAEIFSARGARVAFYVPPIRRAEDAPDTNIPHRLMFAKLHASTGAPVLDFASCQMPEPYFRDGIHMSKLGGSHFTHFVVEALNRK